MARKKTTAVEAASDEAEAKSGLGFEDGIVLSTFLVLVIAVILAYLQYDAFYVV